MPHSYEPAPPIWCAGCGHFGVLHALQAAIAELEIPPHELVTLAGIGCSGTIQNYLGTYGYHALHGRVLPTATGVVLANPDLTVIAAGGDGDGYAIGAGHLVHAFRRNASFTYVVMSNETYGLTKGQRSPTRPEQPGQVDGRLDAVSMGLSISATTFLARGYSGWSEQLLRLARQALEHARARRGFAFLEVISPCVTYWDTYPVSDRMLFDVDANQDYDPSDRTAAFVLTSRLATEGRIPAGLIFQAPARASNATPTPIPARAVIARPSSRPGTRPSSTSTPPLAAERPARGPRRAVMPGTSFVGRR
jgi:2-oxoglutarate ferredoxin oxidoreductase subunit beta